MAMLWKMFESFQRQQNGNQVRASQTVAAVLPANDHVGTMMQFLNQMQNGSQQNSRPTWQNQPSTSNQTNVMIREVDECDEICITAANPDAKLVFWDIRFDNASGKAMFDTGSHLTLMSTRVYCMLNKPLVEYEGRAIKVANGGRLNILGAVHVVAGLEIDGRTLELPMKVAVAENLPFEVIVGNDIIGKCGILVDVGEERLHLRDRDGKLSIASSVQLQTAVSVPPRSRRFVDVTLGEHDKMPDGSYVILSDDCSYRQNQVMLANAVVSIRNGKAVAELTNLSSAAKELPTGLVLGYFEKCEDGEFVSCASLPLDADLPEQTSVVCSASESAINEITDSGKLKKLALKGGEVNIGTHLSHAEELAAQELLMSYEDVFGFGKQLGLCDVRPSCRHRRCLSYLESPLPALTSEA